MDEYKTFHIGVNLFVENGGKILLGKRKNIFGDGTWGLPGGHLEPGEGLREAGIRELEEETGLIASDLELVNLTNHVDGSDHRIQIAFKATSISGKLTNREPERCSALEWFSKNALPDDLFSGHEKQILGFCNNQLLID